MLSDVSPRVAALNRVRTPHLFLGALGTYIALAFAAFELFGALSIGVTFFPPAGFTFACLLLLETRRWPAVVVAILAGEMFVDIVEGMSPGWSLGWAAANSVEPIVGAVVARRLAHEVGLNRRFATAFAVGGLVAGPSVGASIGATVLAVSNDFRWIDGFTDVWIGDALGVLVVAPAVILSMLPSRYLVLPSRRAASLAVVAIVVLGVSFFIVDRVSFGYVAIPLLGWAALSLGARGLAYTAVGVASAATAATARGHGPWFAMSDGQAHDRLTAQQFFLLMAIGGAWLLALEVRRRVVAVEQTASVEAALARAEVRSELVDELQQVFVPARRIRTHRAEIVGFYQPASAELGIGGDWYELFEHSGGLIDVVVGDVVGHGVRAAAVMGRLSSAARAIGWHASDPAAAIARLDEYARDVPDAFCSTVLWCRYRPEEGLLQCARAGHPPPIVRTPDGKVLLLDRCAGLPLACAEDPRTCETIQLPPGSLVLMYTDGLIDSRVRGGRDPLCDLLAVVRDTAEEHPEGFVASTVHAMLGDGPVNDDVAVVCMSLR